MYLCRLSLAALCEQLGGSCLEVELMGTSLVAQIVKNLPAMQETWIRFLVQEDPLEKGMATLPIFLPGEFDGQRSLAGYGTDRG